ncbi:MAG: hypothetical protein ACI8W7_000737 [Gammaproteobacteria bacterium]|jgi:hypothetical protein
MSVLKGIRLSKENNYEDHVMGACATARTPAAAITVTP